MSDFSDNHITDLGMGLLAQVMTGQGVLTFTKVVMGDGNMPAQQTPATMTDVVSPKAQASITKAAVGENGTAIVGARFTNESQQEDFEWKELGLYAKVGESGGEVLYSYGYTPQGELIPAGTTSTTLIEKLVDVVTYIGDAAEVTAVFDPSFIPQVERIDESDIEAEWDALDVDTTTGKGSQYLDRPGLSQLVHDIAEALGDAGTPDEVTIARTADGKLSVKDGGITLDKAAIVDQEGGFASWQAVQEVKTEVEGDIETAIGGIEYMTAAEVDQLWSSTEPYEEEA